MRSDLSYEVAQPDPQGSGDSSQGINRNRVLAALYPADENRRKLRSFCQFFLAQPRSLALGPDAFSQEAAVLRDAAMLRFGHAPLRNQEPPLPSINYTLFCSIYFALAVDHRT